MNEDERTVVEFLLSRAPSWVRIEAATSVGTPQAVRGLLGRGLIASRHDCDGIVSCAVTASGLRSLASAHSAARGE